MGLFEHGIFERKPNPTMLTDTKLRNLKPKDKLYKVNDRDGLYRRHRPWPLFRPVWRLVSSRCLPLG